MEVGPYPVLTHDPDYQASVGWMDNGFGYWYAIVDERGEDVDHGGGLGDLMHLRDLLEATWASVQWSNERAIVGALRPYDDALNSVMPGVQALLLAS